MSQIPIPGEALATDIVQKASPFSKGVALVVGVLILSIAALLYFNKDMIADLRDYRVTIAEMKTELKYAGIAAAAQAEVITLLRTQLGNQAAELDALRTELAILKSNPQKPPP